jgi:hypothetical protein
VKRAKQARRVGTYVTFAFPDGDPVSLPLDELLEHLARQHDMLATNETDDERRHDRLWRKARRYDAAARAAFAQRTVSEHQQRERSKAGKTTAFDSQWEAALREDKLRTAAMDILKDDPSIKVEVLAKMLVERTPSDEEPRGQEALRKELPKLFPQLRNRRRT